MSSRAEEKERRRQERAAAHAAAEEQQRRRARNVRILGGAATAGVLAVIAVVLALSSGGETGVDPERGTRSANAAPVPAVKLGDLDEAAKAAGCELASTPDRGSSHVEGPVTYRDSPPTSGDHAQVPAEDGIYEVGDAPTTEASVHSLEHGRVNIQYTAGVPARRVAQLETVASENDGYHVLLFRNRTRMKATVAATAWTQQLTCARFTDASFDAIRAFRAKYTDKGPEFVP